MAANRLQTAPLGLLGAFQLKTQGDNPTEFQGSVQPVVEAMGFYGVAIRSSVLASGTLTAPGDQLLLTVPQGFVWRVLAVSARAVLEATDVSGFIGFIGVRPTSNTSQALVVVAQTQIVQPATPVAIHASVNAGFPFPFYLGPGGQFVLYLQAAFAAARSCSIQAHVEAYEI